MAGRWSGERGIVLCMRSGSCVGMSFGPLHERQLRFRLGETYASFLRYCALGL